MTEVEPAGATGEPPIPATESVDPARSAPVRFSPPTPYGVFNAADALGGVAAPLMAGFAVALIALSIDISEKLRYPNVALLLFALAAVLLLHVVQVNALAKAYAVTPAQAGEWYADADSDERARALAEELRHHHAIWAALVRRVRLSYNLGVICLLGGVAVLLVPANPQSFDAVRIAAIAVVALACVLEIVASIVDARFTRAVRWRRTWAALTWMAALPPQVRPRDDGE